MSRKANRQDDRIYAKRRVTGRERERERREYYTRIKV